MFKISLSKGSQNNQFEKESSEKIKLIFELFHFFGNTVNVFELEKAQRLGKMMTF